MELIICRYFFFLMYSITVFCLQCISIHIIRHAGWDKKLRAKIKVDDGPSKTVKLVAHNNMVKHYK